MSAISDLVTKLEGIEGKQMKRILALYCRLIRLFGGRHKWGRACERPIFMADPSKQITYGKQCKRCGTVAPVKRRKEKARFDPLTEANQTRYEGQE